MTLALETGDLDQRRIVDHRRAAQQRPRDRHLVLARQLADQIARRVVEQRQALGQHDARAGLGMRDEIAQDAVEQLDVIDMKARRALEIQFGDPPGGLAETFGIAALDDLVEPWDQRVGSGHRTYFPSTAAVAGTGYANDTRAAPGICSIDGNLVRLW